MARTRAEQIDVVRERMARQFLTGRGLDSPVAVVRALGAVQAQDYPGAKWALGMRARGTSDDKVEAAVASGAILRTHVLRPTWHFVAPEDLRWMLALTGPRVAMAMASYNRKLELTPAVFRRSHAVIEKSLRDGKHLTRLELGAALEKARVGPVAGQRLAHLMMQAELDAVICSGVRRGKQFTYALLDERAAAVAPIDRDHALSRLALCYFTTRGPATAHDFSWWSGLMVGDARRTVEILGPAVTPVVVGEKQMWTVERDVELPPAKGTAHLLPNYDEYFIGFKDRSSIGGRARGTELVTGGNALINHVIVINGEIVGGWKRLQSGNGTTVDAGLLVDLTGAERKLVEVQAKRMEAFLGSPVSLEWRPSASRRRGDRSKE